MVTMRTEPVTEATIAELRKQAEADPAAGLPRLAHGLRELGWQADRDRPASSLLHFIEAAAIYERLIADGGEEHLSDAMRALSTLGLKYSMVCDDDRSLVTKREAAALARRINTHRVGHKKETVVLAQLAYHLAEAGRYADAVDVVREVVDNYREAVALGSRGLITTLAWHLLDLAVFLDLAGRVEESLAVEAEILALHRRRVPGKDPGLELPIMALWATGASLRLASAGHREQARELLGEAIAACDQLPADGNVRNFGFLHSLRSAHFARSGVWDEQSDAVGVDPDRAMRPVFGLSFHHWSFSVRADFQAGLTAIHGAIDTLRTAKDATQLAELGTLVRRRNIREAVLHGFGHDYTDEMVPASEASVSIERLLLETEPRRSPDRLVRALTDQAMGLLVMNSNAQAAVALREAYDLAATA
jgi:tetratricopeptide (TPR) repeat protein